VLVPHLVAEARRWKGEEARENSGADGSSFGFPRGSAQREWSWSIPRSAMDKVSGMISGGQLSLARAPGGPPPVIPIHTGWPAILHADSRPVLDV